MKSETISVIKREKIIVIVRGVEKELLLPLAQAMYDGGIRLIEVTFDRSGAVKPEETAGSIRLLCDTFRDKMLIGAGTVTEPEQVELTNKAGGRFIISPDTNEAVIKKTGELGMVSIPGALTPTEIMTAHRAGADFVKLFPVSSLGAAYVRAVSAPLSDVDFLAVGGIDETNMADYLSCGVCGFGIGTNIVSKKLLRAGDFAGITALAEKYVAAVRG